MKIILIILTAWSIIGMGYMWQRIGIELETEAMIDPDEFHSTWHSIAYGPLWWLICLLLRLIIFLIVLISR